MAYARYLTEGRYDPLDLEGAAKIAAESARIAEKSGREDGLKRLLALVDYIETLPKWAYDQGTFGTMKPRFKIGSFEIGQKFCACALGHASKMGWVPGQPVNIISFNPAKIGQHFGIGAGYAAVLFGSTQDFNRGLVDPRPAKTRVTPQYWAAIARNTIREQYAHAL